MAAEALALEPLAWEEEEDEGQRPALALVPERLVAESSSAAVVLAQIEQEHLRGRLPVNKLSVSPGYREDGTRRVWIYGLVDPRDDRIRYAGKSNEPRARLGRYRRCKKQGELHPWLLELRAAGLEPQMYLLEETDEQNFKECEQLWMACCRAADLEGNLNVSKGGERGGVTLIWTDAAIRMAIEEWMREHNGDFPTHDKLIKAGRGDLAHAILKKGYGYWQGVFGVVPPYRSWPDDAIREAIQEWQDEHDGVFPTRAALLEEGRSDLNNAILKKGYAHWQRVFGAPSRKSWPGDAIREAIQEWQDEHDGVFPTRAALLEEGRSDLDQAILKKSYGYWQEVLGVEPSRKSWPEEAIREAIQEWQGEHDGGFPTKGALIEEGRSDLDQAILKKGYGYWQEEFGVVPPYRSWPDDAIREAITAWMDDHNGDFPTQGALVKAGRSDLAGAIQKKGYGYWQEVFGVEPPQKSWPEEAIREAIQEWQDDHNGVFPTKGALIKAGRSDLDSAITKSGGYPHWQRRFGLEPSRKSWPEEAILEAIQEWQDDHDGVFPTRRALIKAGRSDLVGAIQRSGGYRHWNARLNCA